MLSIRVDPAKACSDFYQFGNKQIPYAVSLGLRWIGNDAQKAEQDHIRASFKLRRETFNVQGIKIAKEDRPTKEKWQVVIRLDDRTSYLEKFEESGLKQPVGGRHYLWIPNDKVFKNKIIQAGDPLRPKSLNLHRDAHGRIIGDQHTFMIHPNGKDYPIVVQRTGKSGHNGFTKGSLAKLTLDNFGGGGAGPRQRVEKVTLKRRKVKYQDQATVKLYTLKARVTVPVKLEFTSTLEKNIQANWTPRMQQAMAQAMRTAR